VDVQLQVGLLRCVTGVEPDGVAVRRVAGVEQELDLTDQ
jgi:hypothetical protein